MVGKVNMIYYGWKNGCVMVGKVSIFIMVGKVSIFIMVGKVVV